MLLHLLLPCYNALTITSIFRIPWRSTVPNIVQIGSWNLPTADAMSDSQEPLLIVHPKYFSLELHIKKLPLIIGLNCLVACPPKVTHCVLAGLKWQSHLLPNSLQLCIVDCKPWQLEDNSRISSIQVLPWLYTLLTGYSLQKVFLSMYIRTIARVTLQVNEIISMDRKQNRIEYCTLTNTTAYIYMCALTAAMTRLRLI